MSRQFDKAYLTLGLSNIVVAELLCIKTVAVDTMQLEKFRPLTPRISIQRGNAVNNGSRTITT